MITNTWTKVLPAYTAALIAAGRSPGTVRLHRHYLRHLATFAPRPLTATTAQLTAALAVEHWRPETRKSARGTYAAFYRWAHGTGLIATDPAAGLPRVTVPAGLPRPAPEHVLATALARADPRTRLMLLLAAYGGLRCAEIAAVHREDWTAPVLFVTGKGGKTRIVPIEHPDLVAALDVGTGHLFPGQIDGHLAPATVTKALSRVLPDPWTGHTLRHRFATRSHEHHPDLLALGRVLGHSKPETTSRYVLIPHAALLAVVRAAA